MTGRGWSCEAYGASSELVTDLAGQPAPISELCFFETRGSCSSAELCRERMAGERSRLHAQLVGMRDHGTAEQQLLARAVLDGVAGPSDLLNATTEDD